MAQPAPQYSANGPPQEQYGNGPPQLGQGPSQFMPMPMPMVGAQVPRPCHICGFVGPPTMTYELSGVGILIIVLIIVFFWWSLVAFCVAVWICITPGPGPCHEPRLRCANCGATLFSLPGQII